MNHPVRLKAEKLIRAGDIVGAEHALASLVETEGDDSLVVVLDDFPAKDLLAVLRDFDSSRESVVSLLVSPEQGDRSRNALWRSESRAPARDDQCRHLSGGK